MNLLNIFVAYFAFGSAIMAAADDTAVELTGIYVETDIPYEDDFMIVLQRADGTFVHLKNFPNLEEVPELESGLSTLDVYGILNDAETEMEVIEVYVVEDKDEGDDDEDGMSTSSDYADERFAGNRSVLVVRVKAEDSRTTVSLKELSDSVFGTNGDPVTLASQFDACSYGKLTFSPSTYPGTAKGDAIGTTAVSIPMTVEGEDSMVVTNAVTKALNDKFSVENPAELADHVMYCLPSGTTRYDRGLSWGGFGFFYIPITVYNNEVCTYSSVQMHEILHNLNIRHSNERDPETDDLIEYGDKSGVMGVAPYQSDTKICKYGVKICYMRILSSNCSKGKW